MLNHARHEALLDRSRCALLVVDVQEAFRDYVLDFDALVAEQRLLVEGAMRLGIPVAWTEQYPQGLGATVPELLEVLPDDGGGARIEKLELAAYAADSWEDLPVDVRRAAQFVVVGLEAHVCVRQTVLSLLAAGRNVHVPVDAVGSHTELHRDTALTALSQAGARLSSVEQVLFDWLQVAGTPEFKEVQGLLKRHAAR